MPRSARLALVVLSLAAASSLSAQDDGSSWPHWRGPNRDAVSLETGWSVEGRGEPLWSLNVGRGYSCVSIADGRLFTLGFDEEAQLDRLFCLDPATGEERWRHEWPAEILANFHGGGTLTTPSIDGELVFVTNRFGRGLCLRAATGEVVWERDYAAELDLEPTFHGFSASPLVLEDRLLLVLGDVIACCDKETGDVRWRAGEPGDGGYSNPIPFELEGRRLVAAFIGAGLVVVDPDDGEQVWMYPWKPEAGGVNCCTPIVMGDRVFISSAYNTGAAMIRLGDEETPELVWSTKRFRNKVSSCVLWQDHIYGFDESMLKCIDLEGNERWRVRGLGMGTPAIVDGKLLVLTSEGFLVIADASPDGFDELSRRKVLDDGVYWTPPVLLDGLIYGRNSLGDLVCLDHRRAGAGRTAAGTSAAAGAESAALPVAAALFERHAHLVGAAALREHSSMTVTGEIEITGAGITRCPMTVQRLAPDRWRLDYSLGEYGAVERAYDGEVAWVLDPFYGDEIVTGDARREIEELLAFHHDAEWRAAYPEMETVGRSRFANRECWEVSTVTAGGAERRVYFDVETGLKAGHVADTEALTVYSDWRAFGRVHLPSRTTRLIPDTGAEETTFIADVTWDQVDASAFERPAPVARMLRTPKEIEADAARLRERYGTHLGFFRADFPPYDGAAWRIHVEDGELKLSVKGMPTTALPEPDEDGRVDLPYPEMFLVFLVDENGEVNRLRFSRQGQEVELPRIP